jgi:hypothetical protein
MALLITTYGAPQQVLPKDRAHFTLQELQAFVGGYLEVVGRLPDGRVVWCNEEGKRLQLPVNPRATALLLPLLQPDDVLVGDVLVTTLAEAGEDTDLDPSELVEPLDPEA